MKNILNYKNDHWNVQHLLLLLLLTFLCYWPLTFGIFSAKNDNITPFLPIRFHISEALQNFHLPLWSPYMYLGYPIHGDMQGGAWNPVVWLISFFGRYNVTSLHREILISIFIAGAAMYRLLGVKGLTSTSKLIGAGCYLMCGYITDVAGSNLPFLWAASYIPFVLAYYYHLLTTPSLKYALKTAIALCLLLVSAYPSFFIMTIYILAAGCLVVTVKYLLSKNYFFLKNILISNAIAVLAFLALGAVAIFSYLHILPFYSRGNGVTLSDAMVNSFHPSSSLSFILPSVPVKNPSSFSTDLISRNSYFNCFLLVFLLCYIRMKKTLLLNFTLTGVVFFYLFSLGSYTPLRALCYKLLPLMDTFRHPSNARLFVIIGSIVAGIILLECFIRQKQFPGYLQLITGTLLAFVLTSTIVSIQNSEIASKLNALFSSEGEIRIALKNFFDSLSFYDVLFLNGLLQTFFLLLFLFFQRKHKLHRWLPVLFLANSFFFAQLSIPYTLVSKVSPVALNKLLGTYPNNYPLPDKNSSIRSNSSDALADLELIGISGFYNKKINSTDVAFTPTFMNPIENTMSDSLLKQVVLANPYAYLARNVFIKPTTDTVYTIVTNDPDLLQIKTTGSGNFELKKLWSNGFIFEVSVKDTSVFCLQQLHLPGWKCMIDEKKTGLHSVNGAFMAAVIPPGSHKINFVYRPNGIMISFILTVLSWMIVAFLLIKNRKQYA